MNNYVNPYTGRALQATGTQGIFQDSTYGHTFIENNGQVVSMRSPASGGYLVQGNNGFYNDPYTGLDFAFDSTRSAFIPQYIPDSTLEPARIVGDKLVGIETGRSFDIDPNGVILTPEEISVQREQANFKARLEQMEKDGTIEEYLKEVEDRKRAYQMRLEELRSEDKLADSLRDALNTDIDHILMRFDEIVGDIEHQDAATLEELLNYFNNFKANVNGVKLPTYDDPVIAARLNTRYRELTGQDHPIFIEQAPMVIERYQNIKGDLQDAFLTYYNDDYFVELQGVADYMTQTYPDGLQAYENLSRVDKLRREYQAMGIEMPEEFYTMETLRDRVAEGSLTTDDLKYLCDTTFGKDTPLSVQMYDNFIIKGKIEVSDDVYATSLRRTADLAFGAGSEQANAYYEQIMSDRVSSRSTENTLPTEEMIESATKPELVEMREDIMEANPMLAYRETLRDAYLEEKKPGTYVISQFDMIDGEQPTCHHSLESVSESGKSVITSSDFAYTEEFQKELLEPALKDFAECSPDIKPTITAHVEGGNAVGSTDYRAVSTNNNVVNVNNIPQEYAQEIATQVQQVEPVQFEAQQAELAKQQNLGGYQMILTKTGFVPILTLALLAGFLFGLLIALGII